MKLTLKLLKPFAVPRLATNVGPINVGSIQVYAFDKKKCLSYYFMLWFCIGGEEQRERQSQRERVRERQRETRERQRERQRETEREREISLFRH